MALLLATALAIAAAPAQAPQGGLKKPAAASAVSDPESNEQIVSDFLDRKDRAEKAQRAILLNLRKGLDQKRAEFEAARRRFDEARGRYAEIVGPLVRQGVMNPEDPRLPYEFEFQRAGPESGGNGPAFRRPVPSNHP